MKTIVSTFLFILFSLLLLLPYFLNNNIIMFSFFNKREGLTSDEAFNTLESNLYVNSTSCFYHVFLTSLSFFFKK
jgi:hypothetical protein